MLVWWAFNDDEQVLPLLETSFEIEHIFSKNRQKNEKSLINYRNIESLGNKALLEERINIRASDYRFSDKKKYYLGFTNSKGQKMESTKNKELLNLAQTKADFTENDIEMRYKRIIEGFIGFLEKNQLLN